MTIQYKIKYFRKKSKEIPRKVNSEINSSLKLRKTERSFSEDNYFWGTTCPYSHFLGTVLVHDFPADIRIFRLGF